VCSEVQSRRGSSKEITVMKRHHYACALGLFGLLMVVGARDTRAQVIEARVCFMVGQALYSYTVMHLAGVYGALQCKTSEVSQPQGVEGSKAVLPY
jgi:hypothetical protein